MLTRTQVIERQVVPGDLLYDTLDGRLVRFVRLEPDGYVVVADRNDPAQKPLPDYRHPSQVLSTARAAAMLAAK